MPSRAPASGEEGCRAQRRRHSSHVCYRMWLVHPPSVALSDSGRPSTRQGSIGVSLLWVATTSDLQAVYSCVHTDTISKLYRVVTYPALGCPQSSSRHHVSPSNLYPHIPVGVRAELCSAPIRLVKLGLDLVQELPVFVLLRQSLREGHERLEDLLPPRRIRLCCSTAPLRCRALCVFLRDRSHPFRRTFIQWLRSIKVDRGQHGCRELEVLEALLSYPKILWGLVWAFDVVGALTWGLAW